MKISELLRVLADFIDDNEESEEITEPEMPETEIAMEPETLPAVNDDEMVNIPAGEIEMEPVSYDDEERLPNEYPNDVYVSDNYVSPLQQQHELLKRSQAVPNSFDNDMEELKRLAGIDEPEVNNDISELLKPASVNPKANAARIANGLDPL